MPETAGAWFRRIVALGMVVAMVSMVFGTISRGPSLPTGQRAEDFMAVLDDDSRFELSNQLTVLTFWASWCNPCRQEAPILNRLHDRGVTVVGVSLDPDDMGGVVKKARAMGIRYRVTAQRRDLVRQFRVSAIPTTLVIAADRTVVYAHAGVVSARELQAALEGAMD